MSAKKAQFKLVVLQDLLDALEDQRLALGFHSSNEISVVYLKALSLVPPEKVFEALAAVKKYQRVPNRTGKIA